MTQTRAPSTTQEKRPRRAAISYLAVGVHLIGTQVRTKVIISQYARAVCL